MSRPTENMITPYLVGAGIGALNIVAFLSAKRGIGVSTAFESLAAKTGKAVAPDFTRVNAYVKEREEAPKTDWESLLVLGITICRYLADRDVRVEVAHRKLYQSVTLRFACWVNH